MNFEKNLIRQKIKNLDKEQVNVIVLKGFSVDTYKDLKSTYAYIEPDNIFDKNDRLILQELNNSLFSIIGTLSQIKKGTLKIMLFESFLLVSKNLNLDTLKYNFHIIYNNVVDLYENPTNETIQDYEKLIDKNLALPDNDLISMFYSSCSTFGEKQYVEYVDGLEDEYPQLKYIPLIDNYEFTITKPTSLNELPS